MYTYWGRHGVHMFESPWHDRDTQQAARRWCTTEMGQGFRVEERDYYPGGATMAEVEGERWTWFDGGRRIIVWGDHDAFAFRLRWC